MKIKPNPATFFFLGILFAMLPYDYPLLWTSDAVEPAYLDQLEAHLKFLHRSPPLIGRVLNIMIGLGFLGFFAKLFRPSEANMLFDGASLLMYLVGVGVYVANIVKGLRMVSADYWESEQFRRLVEEAAGKSSSDSNGEVVLGREDSLKVLAASNTILALVLIGVLVLQAGQWYAERKDKEEAEKVEKAEKSSNSGGGGGSGSGSGSSASAKKKQ